MLKKNYYRILVGLLLLIVFLVGLLVYMEDKNNMEFSKKCSQYFLNGENHEGELFINGWAYKNNDEIFIFLGNHSSSIFPDNKNYKYYRVDVYFDDELIDSEESRNINLYDYWSNYKLFKRVKFTKDDFKLVMKVYDKEKGDSLYEKEISVERFI